MKYRLIINGFILFCILSKSILLAQKYTVETLNGIKYNDLTYISITDSSVTFKKVTSTMGQKGEILHGTSFSSILIDDIRYISKHHNIRFSKFGLQPGKFSILRGLAGGIPCGYTGILIGGCAGFFIGSMNGISGQSLDMIVPVSAGIVLGVPIVGLTGFIYFLRHRIGFEIESYDLTNYTLSQKKDIILKLVE